MHVCMHTTCVQEPVKPEEDVGSPGSGVREATELSYGC